ncbi:hypothetical protein GCM10023144_22790 [Pigmentiphaga soli]|uniref:Small-conductance mechanosensitive channel n=1 Tax=Pigmentiphaga soli TaxID=1007095 RepID=A0ABP8H0D2_9BURK
MYEIHPPLTTLRDQLVVWGPRLIVAVIILLITHFLARGARWAVGRLVDRWPALRRNAARPGESLGTQLGHLVYWLIWLVGLIVALQPLGLAQALMPISALTGEVFSYLPRVVGAGLIFFIGLLIARIVRNIVETGLTAARADQWLARAGVCRPAPAAPPDAEPAPCPAISRIAGTVVFALIIIPVGIAALQALGIASIVDPTVVVLQTVLSAIPRVLAAAILLAIAYFIGRWVKGMIEQILPALGFDRALASLGGFAPTAHPSRVAGTLALLAIVLFSAIEAAALLRFDAVAAMLVEVTELGGRVVFGSAIVVVGVIMGRIVAGLVGDSIGESGLPSVLKYAIIALAVAIGLRFMGLANEIVNLAFGLILGSAAVACALAFGLGGRETAHRLLERWTAAWQSGRAASPIVRPDEPPRPPAE